MKLIRPSIARRLPSLIRRMVAGALMLLLVRAPQIFAQAAAVQAGAPMALHIVILDGEDALNNIRQRTAREPIVQVQDENHKPVAAAVVLFTIRKGPTGAGGTFAGVSTLAVITGLDGEAVAKGLESNGVKGSYTISVQATAGAVTTAAVITQANFFGPASTSSSSSTTTSGAHAGGHVLGTHFWIVAGSVAAAAGGVAAVILTHNSGATITAGNGTVHQ
ncbi:MAG TPA: hypothetical protein VIJ79_12720 [Acidobacteriaceae bacterium]